MTVAGLYLKAVSDVVDSYNLQCHTRHFSQGISAFFDCLHSDVAIGFEYLLVRLKLVDLAPELLLLLDLVCMDDLHLRELFQFFFPYFVNIHGRLGLVDCDLSLIDR